MRICDILSNIIFRGHNADNIKTREGELGEFLYKIQVIAEKLYVP